MAITHSIDATRGIVTLHYESDPDFETWRVAMEAAFADAAYRPGMNFLADRRRVSHPPDREYLRSIIKFMNRHADKVQGCRWATIVASAADYGGIPLGQVFTEGESNEMCVFTDPDAARRWLLREPGEGDG